MFYRNTIALVLCLFLLGISILHCENEKKDNVILITLDTLRADRLGCYGNPYAYTPNMDFVAARGTTFQHAICQTPVTLPSHASILTSKFPAGHGVRYNGIFRLAEDNLSIAETMQNHGYTSAAFVSSIVLRASKGLNQGFHIYDDSFLEFMYQNTQIKENDLVERSAEKTSAQAALFMKNNRGSPYFLWIHYYDPHVPYEAPHPFPLINEDDPYQAEVSYLDHGLKSFMKEYGCVKQNTLLVLISDHGEDLGDHSEFSHGMFLYESTIHIPLIFAMEKRIGKRQIFDKTVQSIDIAPTILEIVSIDTPDSYQGTSLFNIVDGRCEPQQNTKEIIYCETFMPYLELDWSPLFAMIHENWKYIECPHPELYQIERDGLERNNVLQDKPETSNQIKKQLHAFIKKYNADSMLLPSSKPLAEDELKKLQSLGYLSGSSYKTASPVSLETIAHMIDPKQQTQYLELYLKAYSLMEEKKIEQALSIFRQVIRQNPGNKIFCTGFADQLIKLNRYAEAIQLYEEFINNNKELQENPGISDVYIKLAAAYQEMGNIKKAVDTVETVLKWRSDDPQIVFQYAMLLVQMKKYNEAITLLTNIIIQQPHNARLLVELGKIFHTKKYDIRTGLKYYKKALNIQPDLYDAKIHIIRAYLDSAQEKKAVKSLKTLLPEDLQIRKYMFYWYLNKKNFSSASEFLDWIIDHFPQDPDIHEMNRKLHGS